MSNGPFPSSKKILIGLCVKQLLHVTRLSRAWRHVALACLLMECPQKPREFSVESHGDVGKSRVWHGESLYHPVCLLWSERNRPGECKGRPLSLESTGFACPNMAGISESATGGC